jgi:hypothetical protein
MNSWGRRCTMATQDHMTINGGQEAPAGICIFPEKLPKDVPQSGASVQGRRKSSIASQGLITGVWEAVKSSHTFGFWCPIPNFIWYLCREGATPTEKEWASNVPYAREGLSGTGARRSLDRLGKRSADS